MPSKPPQGEFGTQAERRSGQKGEAPTAMMQAVAGMQEWKLNIMFGVGLVGAIGIVYWFVFVADKPSVMMLTIAGILFGVCAFFVFPLGITRLADKLWPAKWRQDRRA